MNRRLISILLLLGWFFSWTFIQLQYQLERNRSYHQFTRQKSRVRDDEIETISFPVESVIPWEKEGKEFMLNGKLYDVLSVKKTKTSIVLKCIADSKEDHIVYSYLHNLDKSQKNKKEQPDASKIKVIKYLAIQLITLSYLSYKEMKGCSSLNANLLYTFIEVQSPPPKFYFA